MVCEASSFQLEDTAAFAPEAAVLLNLAPGPSRPPRHVRRLPRRKAAIFAHQPPTGSRSCPGSGLEPRCGAQVAPRDLGAGAGGPSRRSTGGSSGTASRSWTSRRSGCAVPTTSRTRWRRRRSRLARGIEPAAVRAALGDSPASRTGSRRSRRPGRALRRRLQGDQRRLGRGRHPLVPRRRARDPRRPRQERGLRAAGRRVADRGPAAYLIGEEAATLGAALAGRRTRARLRRSGARGPPPRARGSAGRGGTPLARVRVL